MRSSVGTSSALGLVLWARPGLSCVHNRRAMGLIVQECDAPVASTEPTRKEMHGRSSSQGEPLPQGRRPAPIDVSLGAAPRENVPSRKPRDLCAPSPLRSPALLHEGAREWEHHASVNNHNHTPTPSSSPAHRSPPAKDNPPAAARQGHSPSVWSPPSSSCRTFNGASASSAAGNDGGNGGRDGGGGDGRHAVASAHAPTAGRVSHSPPTVTRPPRRVRKVSGPNHQNAMALVRSPDGSGMEEGGSRRNVRGGGGGSAGIHRVLQNCTAVTVPEVQC